jgi:hypothetical protein
MDPRADDAMMSQAPGARSSGPDGDRSSSSAREPRDARSREAMRALERVRTQLARTQRTLDAFVDQIVSSTDQADGDGHADPGSAGRVAPPAFSTDHVIERDPPSDGPAR